MPTHAHRFGHVRAAAKVSLALTAAALSVAIGAGPAAAFTPEADQTAKIGGFIWGDTNKNGLQDEGEKGLAGVTVFAGKDLSTKALEGLKDKAALKKRLAAKGNSTKTLPEFPGVSHGTTDETGAYEIANLEPGTYTVLVLAVNKDGFWKLTTAGLGAEAQVDKNSDFSGEKLVEFIGTVKDQKVDAGQSLKLDAGLTDCEAIEPGEDTDPTEPTDPTDPAEPNEPKDNGQVCGFVWNDVDKDGLQDKGEAPVANLPVFVFPDLPVDDETSEVARKRAAKMLKAKHGVKGAKHTTEQDEEEIPTTDKNGEYCFGEFEAGKYTVVVFAGKLNFDEDGEIVSITKEWTFTTPNVNKNKNDDIDSDVVAEEKLDNEAAIVTGIEVADDATAVVDAGVFKPTATPAPGDGGSLPVTGAAVGGFLAAGMLLVGGGIALTVLGRRRRKVTISA